MHPTLKNVLIVIAGIIVGTLVNLSVLRLSNFFVLPPEGVNPMDLESIKANISNFKAIHFVGPFLAHALGTLAGAFVTAKFAASRNFTLAMVIGFWFFLGGISAVMMIPGPTWFAILDLAAAYFPMAWLGYKLSGK